MDGQFEAEEQRINLGSIKKIDSTINDIIDKSAHVAFYKFDGSSWHKTNVEGSLFVFSRSQAPYYGFVIQNRRNMENVCEALIDGVEFQRASQFLLYKTQNSIHSIWFNEETECIKIARILQQLMQTRNEKPAQEKVVPERRQQERRKEQNARNKRDNVPKPKLSPKQSLPSPRKNNDILDMFHQAHKRYSCSETEPGNHGYKDGYKDSNHGYKDRKDSYKESNQDTKVTILKRDTKQKRGEREVKREEELMLLVKRGDGVRSSPEDEPVRLSAGYNKPITAQYPSHNNQSEGEGKKPITFQELMNSAKPKVSPTPGNHGNNVSPTLSSSPELDKLSLSDHDNHDYKDGNHGKKTYKESNHSNQSYKETTHGTLFNPGPVTKCTTSQFTKRPIVQDLASSAQLLMSPMDFQISPPPLVKTPLKPSPAKRSLFPAPAPPPDPAKRSLFPTPAPPPDHSQYDLDQFKKMLITAIQTDQELVRQMYNALLAQDKR